MPERLSDVPFAELVPATREWNAGRGIDLLSWIGCVGGLEQAIAYGELFRPEFVEFEECVFFAGFSEESYRGFMAQVGCDRRAVETVMNHRHILSFFPGSGDAATREQVVYLGRLLREVWGAELQSDFPERRFVVSFPEEPVEDLTEYEITFFQE